MPAKPYRHVCTEDLVVYHLLVSPPAADGYTYVEVVGSRSLGVAQCTSTQVIGWPPRVPLAMRAHVSDALAAAWRAWRA